MISLPEKGNLEKHFGPVYYNETGLFRFMEGSNAMGIKTFTHNSNERGF